MSIKIDSSMPSQTRDRDLHSWDLTTIFKDVEAWRREAQLVCEESEALSTKVCGSLDQSGEHLFTTLQAVDELLARQSRVSVYADLTYSANTKDEAAESMSREADNWAADVSAHFSFVAPELLSIGWARIEEMLSEYPALERYRFYLSEIESSREHTLSQEQEDLLSQLSPLLSIPEQLRNALHEGDMTFEPVPVDGQLRELTHGTVQEFLMHPDRAVRKQSYDSYAHGYFKTPKTFAAAWSSQVSSSLLFARARNFTSTFDEMLFDNSIDARVYDTAIQACEAHQGLFQRYFKARASLLGVPVIGEYDLFAPLAPHAPEIPYERAVELVLQSLAPLGNEYVQVAKRGLTSEQWVDVFPRVGKYSNAFSSGTFGTRPFILMNYAPTMAEVGTLAHELGHSMHSYFTHKHQPDAYSDYAMTVAETASNLNQVLLRAHVLKTADAATTLSVLDEAFYFAHRYLFMMPLLSQLEHHVHSTYADGESLGGEEICEVAVKLFAAAYGDSVSFEPEKVGMKWAQFCHLYEPYYVFQYSIGISAAMSIGARILAGESGIVDRYLEFLSAGASKQPKQLFEIVGVDISSSRMYEEAFGVVEGYVRQLEAAISTPTGV
jgi:oligoendopeptidase F